MKKRIYAAILAVMFAFLNVVSAIPAAALEGVSQVYATPSGYNENDYQKLLAFLEQSDENEVKNGTKLSGTYDPADPATWGSCITWQDFDGEKRVTSITASSMQLCGSLDLSECAKLTELNCNSNSITEVNVQNCGEMTKLYCTLNEISAINLSGTVSLQNLWCNSNNLDSIDVSCCPELSILKCYTNSISALDVSSCTALTKLDCSDNNLTTLDVRNCTLLATLYCYRNNLTEIQLGNLPSLKYLYCYSNNLASLDVSGCPVLKYFSCYSNMLTSIDIGSNPSISEFVCDNNRLTEIDMSNNPSLPRNLVQAEGYGYVGYKKSSSEYLVATPIAGHSFIGWYNQNDELLSTSMEWRLTSKTEKVFIGRFDDGNISYDTPAGYNENDYQKLVTSLEQVDNSGIKNGKKVTSNYNPNDPTTWGPGFTWVEVNGEKRISKVSVTSKNCIGTFDVSDCSELKIVYLGWNKLAEINLSGCTALEKLNCTLNNLTELDLSGCSSISDLTCSSNSIETLNLNGCVKLYSCVCNSNNISELDLTGCSELTYVDCSKNSIETLILTDCAKLWDLECASNNIHELDLSDSSGMTYLDVTNNDLTTLDISMLTDLQSLSCTFNNLTSIDLSKTSAIKRNTVNAVGNGYVGYTNLSGEYVQAVPNEDGVFIGWYSTGGELLSSDAKWNIGSTTEKAFVARFALKPTVLGDFDDDGVLSFADITLLYYYLLNNETLNVTEQGLANADVNSDGALTVADITAIYSLILGEEN